MLTEQIETIQRTAYEGLLAPTQSIGLGVLAAVVAGWLLWRQRHALGSWGPLFWLTRIGAIGLALWMLAGPTHLAIERVTSPQSIALLIDDTRSMTVTDPPEPVDDLRWRLAVADGPRSAWERLVVLADRAGAPIAEAVAASEALRDAVAEHRPTHQLRPIVERTLRAMTATHQLLQGAANVAATNDDLLADRIDRVLLLLDETAAPSLDRIAEQVEIADPAGLDALAGDIETLCDTLAAVQRRRQSFARDAASRATDVVRAPPPSATRRERVDALIAKLEAEVLGTLDEKCLVHRLRFSQFTTGSASSNVAPGLTPVAAAESLPASGNATTSNQAARSVAPAGVTDLAAALQQIEQIGAAEPLRMAFLLTDGKHNAPAEVTPREVAARLGATPVSVTPIGASKPLRDLIIHRVEAPSRVVRKDKATIDVLLTALDCAGEEVDVVLTRDGQELDRQRLKIARAWQGARVRFQIDTGDEGDSQGDRNSQLGRREYEVEVDAVEDEASLTNNLGVATVEVVRDRLRVLLADRGPRWEYRYLQQLFRRDKHVEFDELLRLPQLRATGRRKATGNLPANADDWAEYDVVILGDLGPTVLGDAQQRSLAEYVRNQGGAVILIAGRESMPQRHLGAPLIELLPVTQDNGVTPRDGFGVVLTDEARLTSSVALRKSFTESQQTWQAAFTRLPIYGLSRYCRPKPNANVLVEASPIGGRISNDDTRPLAFFSWHALGAGKVAYLAAPQSYALRFRRGDRDHHAFWGQTLRWITASQGGARAPVRIDTDRTQYADGQRVEVTVWLRDAEGRPVTDAVVQAEARSLDGVAATTQLRTETDVPGRYVGAFPRLPSGAFEIVPTGEQTDQLLATADPPRKLINVESSTDIEMLDTQCDRPLLEQIAKLTGGQVTPPTAIAELLRTASLDPQVTESPPRRTPLWDRWSYLLVIAGCLATEWIVRKAKGLT